MWSESIVIILFILMLTHVNSQGDVFNVTTNNTQAENLFKKSTHKTAIKEKLFDTLVSKIPVEENSFDISTTERIAERNSLAALTNKTFVNKGSLFVTPTSETSLEEDFYKASTTESTVEDDSYNTSTAKTSIEEESFYTSLRESSMENYYFNALTSDQTPKVDSFEVFVRKILAEEDSLVLSTTEATVEEGYFDIPSNKPSINDTFVNENSFGVLKNETLTLENSVDTPISETPVEEYSYDISTRKIFVKVNSYDLSTTEATYETFFDASTTKVNLEEDSFDTSINKTLVKEETFEPSVNKTLLEEDSFYASTTETTIEEDSFYTSTTEASVFDASTSKVIIEEDSIETTTSKARIRDEERMSTYILKVIEHYKQPDPQGFPGARMPDPLLVPDSSQFIAFGTNLDFTDTTLHGVNKFHIVNVTADIGKMECRANFEMDLLQVRGKYSLSTWLTSYPGGFLSDISGLKSEVIARLGVEQDGKLRAQDISIDITYKNITIQFENAGFLSSMLQGLFDSMGSMMYDTIKSYLLKDARTNMRDDINKKLDLIVGDIEFPNTISPMDMILVDLRKKIKDMEMDPLCIEDYSSKIGLFSISLSNTKIKGLSTFHRVGNITLRLKNNTAVSDFNIGTKELQGLTNWEVSGMNGLLNKTGSFSFSVEYIQARFVLAQAMDTRKGMKFKEFHLDVGNIQIRSDGTGTLDYIIEMAANIVPSLLRYQIIAVIENPIKWKIQQELDRINVEEAIVNELPRIDKVQEDGFQLAELRRLNSTDEINFDDDEFFDF